MNINSNNIVVFPSVNRSVAGTTHKESVQFTELNVTQIINRIVDRDSFIVKVSLSDASSIKSPHFLSI